MIQLNLLPSIKAEYQRAKRTKRTVASIAIIISISALVIIGLLSFVAYGTQKFQLNNLDKKIATNENKIKEQKDIDKILTIQNQLNSLTGLHDNKPVLTRLFTYLQQTTPSSVTIDSFDIDTSVFSWEVTGKAPSIELINKYVDTLKFTEIAQTDPTAEKSYAFKNVVLSNFSKGTEGVTYAIAFSFNDQLFASQSPNIALVVPNITTTRSQLQLPSEQLLSPNPEDSNQNEQERGR